MSLNLSFDTDELDGPESWVVYQFGIRGYRQLQMYRQDSEPEKRYSPAKCLGAEKHRVMGNPDAKAVSTSFVERQNLTMPMSMRRFTRLTNGFSKKLENHEYALALHFMHYNFVRPHKTLANPYPRTPAMAVGITDHVWLIEEVLALLGTEQADSM